MDRTDQWSHLPDDLLDLIANRYSSNIDVLRIRSVCKSWRSAVAMSKERLQFRFDQDLLTSTKETEVALFPTTYFRITLPSSSSSCPNKGWLIQTRQASKYRKKINLLCPLSDKSITRSHQTLDLLNVGVSEIFQSFKIEEGSRSWNTIKNQCCVDFSDIIHHMGHIYAVDIYGTIWCIDLSQLSIARQTPPNIFHDYIYDSSIETRLVEYCGDLCVSTFGFIVNKMDKDLTKWVYVNSLGDKALIVAWSSCFTVVASEYHGCLKNSVYFPYYDGATDQREVLKVYKLDDGSIIKMTDITSQSCFDMFSPPFISNY
ncbi:hypothetical protein CARUB_v10018951mg [Capsella rubella]|uniref:F-box domain-containing protein n=1 Tax=Capsella rubella TaxID=81985 RepID=R0HNU7_9BRAS|nr:hypothetical protein CARUB_v10018951mg [Capsella rubella]